MISNTLSYIISIFKGNLKTDLSINEWERIIFILRECDTLPMAYESSKISGTLNNYPEYAIKHMHAAQIYSKRQAQQVRYECTEIAKTLEETGIQPVFLKGAGYTLRNSRNSLGRIYTDIDVLVPKHQLNAAEKALNRHSWSTKRLNNYDERYYRQWSHEIPPMFQIHRGTVLDLHHNIVPPMGRKAKDISSLLSQTVLTTGGFKVLSPEATVLHSSAHLFTNEDFSHGFRDLIDLYVLISDFESDTFWEKLLLLAYKTELTLELYYALTCCKFYWELNIPDDINTDLRTKHKNILTAFNICIFKLGLQPHHPLIQEKKHSLACLLIFIRGHWKKMPKHLLLFHIISKAWTMFINQIFGKHHFDPPKPDLHR
ncbi:MAG: nucleotidyltransferase family protein [Halopseudomonas sp.]